MELILNTPLFMGGANPNEESAEIRPASFRGCLRYWLRTLLANEVGDNTPLLQTRENAIFGDTEGSSSIIVRVSASRLSGDTTFDLQRDGQQKIIPNGYNYLYYSTKLGENKRKPIAPNSVFGLTLTARRGAPNGQQALAEAEAALWLITNLGGVGMRARRCGGSVQEYRKTWESVEALNTYLAEGIREKRLLFGGTLQTQKYDCLHPNTCRVWVLPKEYASCKDALEDIGTKMKAFRAAQRPDHNRKNAIFGLPIMHDPETRSVKRRSSPLWLRITKLDNGSYVGVATLFKSEFLPGKPSVGSGYPLIEQLVTSEYKGLEVQYR